MARHALLSASSATRWLNCPASVRLCESMADETSVYAEEGTEAHALCEHLLKQELGQDTQDPRDNFKHLDTQMEECASDYVSYVLEKFADAKTTCKDPVLLIEQKLDFSRWVPDGFGTADCVIVADSTLTVIDFKYGQGVEVLAEKNPQMMLYALGAIAIFEQLYDIEGVNMCIFQPRKANISEWSTSKDELLTWAKDTLKPKAESAFAGTGDFSAGSWCRFCRAKATCRCRAKANLEIARHEFAEPATLTDDEVADVLAQTDELKAWADDVKTYALAQALKGKKWREFKLVEGRSTRHFTDEAQVASVVKQAGFDPYESKLKGITAMTRLLGKAKFQELLCDFIEKPVGKPTLVKDTDKRPEITTAQIDFKEDQNV